MQVILGGKRGGFTLVSEDDYEKVNQYSWYQDKTGYIRGTVNGKSMSMHRFIMNPDENEIVDHINHNKSDNRSENLRKFTTQKNAGNRKIKENKLSKYRGVYFNKKRNRFYTNLIINGKKYNIGAYKIEIEAAENVDKFILYNNLYHIDLNFPEKKEQYLTENYKPPIKKNKKFTGVIKYKEKFRAEITVNNKGIRLLISENEIDCAKAYDDYVVKNNIPKRKLNFPKEYPNYNPNCSIKTLYEKIDDFSIKLITNKSNTIIIDLEDYDRVKNYTCFINKTSGYPMIITDKTLLLSRFLTNTTNPKIYVDHIDSNILNNKKNNLRLSCPVRNGQNKSKRKNATSKYIGVYFDKRSNKWMAQIMKNGKSIFHKSTKFEIIAARAHDLFILENLKDDHYKLNFIWDEFEIKIWKEFLRL